MTFPASKNPPNRIFYGWWIVVAAFLNLFFVVGIIFYGFPVFYPYFVESLGFTRAQVTQGFFLGFLFAGLPFGVLAGTIIDRIGARFVILAGVALVGVPLLLMGSMTRFWQFEILCVVEVIGFVLAGPMANQVLIARWFRQRRGQAMGYAYLGLGLGGVVAPLLVNRLAGSLGWRHALEFVGLAILVALFPVGIWVTRSSPEELGLVLDGVTAAEEGEGSTAQNSVGVYTGGPLQRVLAAAGRIDVSGRRYWSRGSTLHPFPERRRFLVDVRCPVLNHSARIEPGRPSDCRLSRRPFPKDIHHGVLLFSDWSVCIFACKSTFARGAMDVRDRVWVFDGRGLYAHPAGDCGVLRNCFARQVIGTPHHGIFDRAMGGPLDGRENF